MGLAIAHSTLNVQAHISSLKAMSVRVSKCSPVPSVQQRPGPRNSTALITFVVHGHRLLIRSGMLVWPLLTLLRCGVWLALCWVEALSTVPSRRESIP